VPATQQPVAVAQVRQGQRVGVHRQQECAVAPIQLVQAGTQPVAQVRPEIVGHHEGRHREGVAAALRVVVLGYLEVGGVRAV
jgi:hypothetical protein